MDKLKTDISVDDDTLVVKYSQDISKALDQNKQKQLLNPSGYVSDEREVKEVAFIPDVVIMEWRKEGIDIFNKDHWHAVKRKLNDPAYLYLRTSKGRV